MRRKKIKTSKRVNLQSLAVVHPDAAGIDVGAKEHVVAVPCSRDERPVRPLSAQGRSAVQEKNGISAEGRASASYAGFSLELSGVLALPKAATIHEIIRRTLLKTNKRRIIIFQLGQRRVHRRHYLRTQLGRILGVEADLKAA
jgi:hypothetical protein